MQDGASAIQEDVDVVTLRNPGPRRRLVRQAIAIDHQVDTFGEPERGLRMGHAIGPRSGRVDDPVGIDDQIGPPIRLRFRSFPG